MVSSCTLISDTALACALKRNVNEFVLLCGIVTEPHPGGEKKII